MGGCGISKTASRQGRPVQQQQRLAANHPLILPCSLLLSALWRATQQGAAEAAGGVVLPLLHEARPCLPSTTMQAATPAVFVDKTTKVICQGLTGKNGTFHTEQVGRPCSDAAASSHTKSTVRLRAAWTQNLHQNQGLHAMPHTAGSVPIPPRRLLPMALRWWAA